MKRFLAVIGLTLLAGGAWFGGAGDARAQGDLPDCAAYPRGQETYECMCPPSSGTTAAVWGSGPYTLDSNVCRAALHAGMIGPEGGPVMAEAVAGQSSYEASVMNGVQTSVWGAYDASFLFVEMPTLDDPVKNGVVSACAGFPDNLDIYVCSCTPQATAKGTFWGNDPYTIDSDLCIAARHSGIIDEDGGTISALRVIGLDFYYSSQNNGVQSLESGPFGGSVVFDRN